MKIDKTVKRETMYVALGVLGPSVVLQLVFFFLGKWDMTVFLGNLLGIVAGVLNFFLMGLTVQKAVTLDEKEAAAKIKLSQLGRHLMLGTILVFAGVLPCFNLIATGVTLFFPRLAVMVRGFTIKDEPTDGRNEVADDGAAEK